MHILLTSAFFCSMLPTVPFSSHNTHLAASMHTFISLELANSLGMQKLNEKFGYPMLASSCEGLMPRDDLKIT